MPFQDFIDRVDAKLDLLSDDGERACFLNACLERAEKNFKKLSDWARAADGRPNPLGEGIDAFDVNDVIIELQARLVEIRANIKRRVTEAENTIIVDRNFRLIEGGLAR